MVQIIPAILATDEDTYKQKLDRIVDSGAFEDGWVQIDLMDSKFVENQSVEPEIVGKYKSPLKLEAQLMVAYPEGWIDELINAGVNRIVFPVEDEAGIGERIGHIKNHQIQVGLSLNPETDIEKLEPFLDTIDVVLIMSVHPGFGGQEFLPETIERVKELARLRQRADLNYRIEVDGGINDFVAPDLVQAGADNLVIGSHLIEGDIDENLEKIWEAIKGKAS